MHSCQVFWRSSFVSRVSGGPGLALGGLGATLPSPPGLLPRWGLGSGLVSLAPNPNPLSLPPFSDVGWHEGPFLLESLAVDCLHLLALLHCLLHLLPHLRQYHGQLHHNGGPKGHSIMSGGQDGGYSGGLLWPMGRGWGSQEHRIMGGGQDGGHSEGDFWGLCAGLGDSCGNMVVDSGGQYGGRRWEDFRDTGSWVGATMGAVVGGLLEYHGQGWGTHVAHGQVWGPVWGSAVVGTSGHALSWWWGDSRAWVKDQGWAHILGKCPEGGLGLSWSIWGCCGECQGTHSPSLFLRNLLLCSTCGILAEVPLSLGVKSNDQPVLFSIATPSALVF